MGKLVIDGNSVYEIDEECLRKKESKEKGTRDTEKEYRDKGMMQRRE